MDALKTWKNDKNVCLGACKAIRALAWEEALQIRLVKLGVCSAVVQILIKFESDVVWSWNRQ